MELPKDIEKKDYVYEELTGIGGWLGVFAGWLMLSVLISLFQMIDLMTLENFGAAISSARGPYLVALLAVTALFICVDIAIVVMLFKHKIAFRILFVAAVAVGFTAEIVLALVVSDGLGTRLPSAWSFIVRMCISGGWIAYLFQSKRVKNTYEAGEEKEVESVKGDRARNDFI